jgi:Family of unknown function (DUF6152)
MAVKRTLLTMLTATMIAGVSASAHHSFAAHYFEEQTVSVEGELLEFEYKSPHAWVHVMAKDDDGEMQQYGAEWAGPGRLQQRGVKADTLKPGDWVIISGSPGRNPSERRIHLKSIKRPADGWSWPALQN